LFEITEGKVVDLQKDGQPMGGEETDELPTLGRSSPPWLTWSSSSPTMRTISAMRRNR
jgi:hypothetical protein